MTPPRYEQILVPLDGSDDAAVALRTADALAAQFGATVQTLSVGNTAVDVDRDDERVHTNLIPLDLRRASARTSPQTLQVLLVVSTHARSGVSRRIGGASATHIIAAAPVATVVVLVHD